MDLMKNRNRKKQRSSKEIDFDSDDLLTGSSDTTYVDINFEELSLERESGSEDSSPVQNDIIISDSTDLTLRSERNLLVNMRDGSTLDDAQLDEKKIIHPGMEDHSILHHYREIRTYLLQKSEGKNFVLLVVSLAENMGATFTTVNLASAFSYEGEKTSLIVDCNLQRPKLQKIFNRDLNFGLTDYLEDNTIDLEKIIFPTGINRMRFIPIGLRKETQEEFFSSSRVKEVIRQLKKRFSDRFIFLNAPPLESSADAAILSNEVDFVVVVIPYGKVTKNRIAKAVRLIPKEKVAGYILNNTINYV